MSQDVSLFELAFRFLLVIIFVLLGKLRHKSGKTFYTRSFLPVRKD